MECVIRSIFLKSFKKLYKLGHFCLVADERFDGLTILGLKLELSLLRERN